jgi:hypothetical protein
LSVADGTCVDIIYCIFNQLKHTTITNNSNFVIATGKTHLEHSISKHEVGTWNAKGSKDTY